MKISLLLAGLALLTIRPLVLAQDYPRLEKTLPPVNLPKGGRSTTIDLAGLFSADNIKGPLVEFYLPAEGSIYLELYPDIVPRTVNNFLSYVNEGKYDRTFIHRAATDFVIQGGGFYYSENYPEVPIKAPVMNEFKLSNLRGTVAMAKIAGDLNSATAEWFFNLANNTHLDASDQKFTVFGRLIGNGVFLAADIGRQPKLNLNADDHPGGPFGEVPYYTDNTTTPATDYLFTVEQVRPVPLLKLVPATGGYLTITARSSQSSVVRTEITPGGLKLTSGRSTGTAIITVRATDPYDRWLETTFAATAVNPRLPVVNIRAIAGAITEGSGRAGRIRLSRTGSRSKSLKVRLATTGSSASNGSDVVKMPGSATIPKGKSSVDLKILSRKDARPEGTEVFTETLLAHSSYTIAPSRSASVRILDDDVPTVTLRVMDGTLGETGSNTATLRLTRTGSKAAPLPIFLSVAGNAELDVDYTATPASLTIPAGNSSLDATLSGTADFIKEGSETILISPVPSKTYNIPGKPVSLTLLDTP